MYAPPGETLSGSFALSPNGRRIVFVANRQLPQQSRLWLRDLDGVAERPLPDTEGASLPFWSPDGKHLGFFAHGRLETIDVESGRIAELAAARRGRGGTWNAAGVILYAPDINSPIMSVPATGGIPVAVTDRAGAPSHRFPSFLPDGRHFIYLVLREDRHASEIGWGRLGGGENGRVLAASSNAVCTGAGQIFFARESTLFAQALDFATMRPLGSPVVVSDRVGVYGEEGPTGLGAFAVSVDGVVAITDVLRPAVRLAWFDRRGHPLPTAGPAGDYIAFDLAADDVHVAAARFDARKRSSDIVTFDLRSGVQTQVTDDPWPDAGVTWAPKGSLLAFISLREGGWTAFLRDTAQGGDERRIGPCDSLDAWSPDGGQVLCKHLSDTADGAVPLWQLPVGGSHKPGLVLEDAGIDGQARVSPDGHWLAYTRDEGLPDGQLYVAQMKSGRAAGRQSVGSGVCPRWRRDGGELFFLNGTRLMSVPVESRGVVRFGSPRVLFEAPLAPHDSLADFGVQFGVASDGTRFLIATPIETQPSVPIRITPASAIPKQGAGIE